MHYPEAKAEGLTDVDMSENRVDRELQASIQFNQ
jgi:hypothetical protein